MGREGGEKTRGRGANEKEKPRKESRGKGEELCWGDMGAEGRTGGDLGEAQERPMERNKRHEEIHSICSSLQETLAWLPCSLSKVGEKEEVASMYY